MKDWYRGFRQDLHVLRALFPWKVGLTLVISIGLMALIFQRAYLHAYELQTEDFSYVKAIYAILNMASFQVSFADMPPGPRLDIFFIIVPLVGIPMLLAFGANLVQVVRVFFVRRERGQMWQRALAATVDRPIVVLGLGHIGYRVALELLDSKHRVIGLDNTDSPLVQDLIDRGMPVILGDARDKETLEAVGVSRAAVVIVCTYNDLANIEAAFHVRELNRKARVVLRLFEEGLFGDVSSQFEVESILSRSAIAAQAFAYAAVGIESLESFGLNGDSYVLAEMPITPTSTLAGQSLQQIADAKRITIVCLYRDGSLRMEPTADTVLTQGDVLFIFTRLDHMALLAKMGPSGTVRDTKRIILVCGIGHTGYRVARTLHSLGQSVVGLDFERSHLAERLEEMKIPIVYGDFRRASVLQEAGIAQAEAIVTCTDEDMVNLETGMRSRELVPSARIVMRIFEEPLGNQLEQAFGIDAVYSTSALAVPAFVAAALNIHLTQPVVLGGNVLHMARIKVEAPSNLVQQSIGELTEHQGLTVLMHKRCDHVQIPPDASQCLISGDEIVILATPDKLREIDFHNGDTENTTYLGTKKQSQITAQGEY